MAPGEALRARLAAQADEAFASGAADNTLKQMMLQEPGSRQGRKELLDGAASKMLERPPLERQPAPEEEAIDQEALRQAAEMGDLDALARMDKRLKKLLESDEQLQQLLKAGDFNHPQAKEALRLYRSSFMTLETHGRDTEKDAFAAVTKDDAEALKLLLERGLRRDVKNQGGYTLLQLARERQKTNCEKVLLDLGVTS